MSVDNLSDAVLRVGDYAAEEVALLATLLCAINGELPYVIKEGNDIITAPGIRALIFRDKELNLLASAEKLEDSLLVYIDICCGHSTIRYKTI